MFVIIFWFWMDTKTRTKNFSIVFLLLSCDSCFFFYCERNGFINLWPCSEEEEKPIDCMEAIGVFSPSETCFCCDVEPNFVLFSSPQIDSTVFSHTVILFFILTRIFLGSNTCVSWPPCTIMLGHSCLRCYLIFCFCFLFFYATCISVQLLTCIPKANISDAMYMYVVGNANNTFLLHVYMMFPGITYNVLFKSPFTFIKFVSHRQSSPDHILCFSISTAMHLIIFSVHVVHVHFSGTSGAHVHSYSTSVFTEAYCIEISCLKAVVNKHFQ